MAKTTESALYEQLRKVDRRDIEEFFITARRDAFEHIKQCPYVATGSCCIHELANRIPFLYGDLTSLNQNSLPKPSKEDC